MNPSDQYQSFLSSLTKKQWQQIGLQRRAGVATPLFSIYSDTSIGIGELPDLNLLVDWCKATGMSIIQLLPMNDVGFNFTPYDAQSSFALEPMYLSLEKLVQVDVAPYKKDIESLRRQFPAGKARVNYKIKQAKLDLLWKIFQQNEKDYFTASKKFIKENQFWIDDYVLFKVIKEIKQEAGWEEWGQELKQRDEAALKRLARQHASRIQFHQWLQWQLFEQFRAAKNYARNQGVLLMGDLPFLVSRDSADVWAHQNYFKLNLSSGAPPDRYFFKGQRWGMPPYRWSEIASCHYDYIREKLRYAQNFYDLFRIDHVVGIFRVWTISLSEPAESHGLNGLFDPPDENLWEAQGRSVLSVMIENTSMLPCAEDLGVVPKCSYRALEEFGIPGLDVQRWNKHWDKGYFKTALEYRKNSIAVISSHDTSSLRGWWEFEAGTVDGMLFERLCETKGISFHDIKDKLFDLPQSHHGRMRWKKEIQEASTLLNILGRSQNEVWDLVDLYNGSYNEKQKFLAYLDWTEGREDTPFSPAFVRRVLERVSESASVFSVQLLQDWLSLKPDFQYDSWDFRINFPGTFNDQNWTLVVPFSLEKLLHLEINPQISEINQKTFRI